MTTGTTNQPATNGTTATEKTATNGDGQASVAPTQMPAMFPPQAMMQQMQQAGSTIPQMTLPAFSLWQAWMEYSVDATQRYWMLLDVLRQRGNQFFEHRDAGQPPVLVFDYEMLIDGKTMPNPVNYYLLKILPGEGIEIDNTKRPFVIVDPRAGHGPGIGGSKEASQVGVALRGGHPVYFVGFRPVPEPGQTLTDIANAQAHFLREVVKLHPDSPRPCVVGNCQAGWAVAMLASVEPDLLGPIVLNGAPLSYWAGVDGKNPIRYLGGIGGGSWMTYLLADMGGGIFDGAYLVQNFENLNPANTLWAKQYNLYANIDTEPARYLNFEKWWQGFTLLNAEEMESIVDNLFVGNKLEAGQLETTDGRQVDLKNIKAPIVVFASEGDNITAPQQALNWLTDVYESDEDILKDEQVIVYTVHKNIGHLGIFVSGSVAKREHTAIVGTMDFIDALPPGLYEMVIEQRVSPPANDPFGGKYEIRFDERSLKDIASLDDGREDEDNFPALAAVSDFNVMLYTTFLRPWVRAFSTPQSAYLMRETHPNRVQHYIFSDRNPFMMGVKMMAEMARANRQPVSRNNPFLRQEKQTSETIINTLNSYRDARDDSYRVIYNAIYGPLGLGAFFPTRTETRKPQRDEREIRAMFANLIDTMAEGGFAVGFARVLMHLSRADRDVEPRAFILLAQAVEQNDKLREVGAEKMRQFTHDQFVLLRIAEEDALKALPQLLPTQEERREAYDLAKHIILFEDQPNKAEVEVMKHLEEILELA